MGDDRIDELLEKLEKLDPETWDALEHALYWTEIEYEEYVIQGVIQDAIVARGWGCYQYHYDRRAPKKEYAYIRGGAEGEGETPVEALLAAYVAALEAEADK